MIIRVLVIADTHSGAKVGLTPPRLHYKNKDKWNLARIALYNDFKKSIDRIKPVDILIFDGDAIDGDLSGGKEQFISDRNEQIKAFIDCISIIEAPETYMVMGSYRHVGKKENWEEAIAQQIKAKAIDDQLFLDIEGVIFDVKHFLPGTSVPYSKGTQIEKAHIWNILWHEREIQPKADVTIRAHRHFFHACLDDKWLGISLPGLLGYGSRHGVRYFSNIVHVGLVYFDIERKGKYSWGWDIFQGEYLKSPPLVISHKKKQK